MSRSSFVLALCACATVSMTAAFAVAEELKPTLGTKGKLLFEESFDGVELSKKWTYTVGALRLDNGALLASEHASSTGAPLVATLRDETLAGTVVTGSYYRVRDSLHLQAQLIDTRSGALVSRPLRGRLWHGGGKDLGSRIED